MQVVGQLNSLIQRLGFGRLDISINVIWESTDVLVNLPVSLAINLVHISSFEVQRLTLHEVSVETRACRLHIPSRLCPVRTCGIHLRLLSSAALAVLTTRPACHPSLISCLSSYGESLSSVPEAYGQSLEALPSQLVASRSESSLPGSL
ncbi:hypothetical protein Tco_0550526 [Tanacetum coccineum]